jgi:hypothetical protein
MMHGDRGYLDRESPSCHDEGSPLHDGLDEIPDVCPAYAGDLASLPYWQHDPVEDPDCLQSNLALFTVFEFVLLNDRANLQAYRPLATRLLLGSRVLSIQPCQENLLRGCAGRDQGQHAIGAKGLLPEALATDRPGHQDEDIAACRSRFHAKPAKALVPADLIGRLSIQIFDQRIHQLECRHVTRFPMLPAAHIDNAANETPGTA